MARVLDPSVAPDVEPEHAPNFGGKFVRMCKEKAQQWGEQEIAQAVEAYFSYKDGLLVNVMRIMWSLWRFAEEHRNQIPCVLLNYREMVTHNGNVQSRGIKVKRSFTTQASMQQSDGFQANFASPLGMLYPAFLAAENEAHVLFPDGINLVPLDLGRAFVVALMVLYGNDRVPTQHDDAVKVPGRLLDDFIVSYNATNASQRFNAADRLTRAVRSESVTAIQYLDASKGFDFTPDYTKDLLTGQPVLTETRGYTSICTFQVEAEPLSVAHWGEIYRWFADLALATHFAELRDIVREARNRQLLDGLQQVAKRARLMEEPTRRPTPQQPQEMPQATSQATPHEDFGQQLDEAISTLRSLLPALGEHTAVALWSRIAAILSKWRESRREPHLPDLLILNELELLMGDPSAKLPSTAPVRSLFVELVSGSCSQV
jgi:hypothetical protein